VSSEVAAGAPVARVLPATWPAWGAWALAWCAVAATWQVAGSPWLERQVAGPPVCALQGWLGLACPTCGATRALALLAHGQWGASLALHPLPALLATQVMALWLAWGAWLSGAVRSRPDRWVPHVVGADLAAMMLYWVVRMVSGTLPA
jgi:hypothetical protein